jgi:hypothetical protein
VLISPQIPLPLEPPRADRFEEFVAGPNAAALAAVRHLLDEPPDWLPRYTGMPLDHAHSATTCC